MIGKRRYEIGDIRKPRPEILQWKMAKIKFVCFICIFCHMGFSMFVILRAKQVEESGKECTYETTGKGKDQTVENANYFCHLKLALINAFFPRERTIIEYRKQPAFLEKDGTKNNYRPKYQNIVHTISFDQNTNDGNASIPGYLNFTKHDVQNVSDSTASLQYTTPLQESSLGARLNQYLTQPTTTCKRLARIGGRSCLGAYDGSKLVCMDSDVRPQPTDCLVYSFGVGNDFSFDNCMQDYGCEVHSFDHDDDHEIYDYRQGPLAFFHKARIGHKDGYYRTCEESQYGLKCEPSLRYYTMATIRRMLHHDTRNVDYLKMDIEGAEWFVFGDVIHNSTVLQQTRQIALEIHLDEVNRQTSGEELQETLKKYLSVFSDLQKLGFAVAAFEENGMRPIYSRIDGTLLSIYAEILLLKRNESTITTRTLTL